MQITLDAGYLSSRLLCSQEAKLECMETVKQLWTLNQLVRKEGVMAMDEFADVVDDSFLSAAMHTATAHTEHLESILYASLISGDYYGKDFLKNLLLVCGLPALCEGISSKELIARLQGWFGMDFLPFYHSEIEQFYIRMAKPQKREQSLILEFDAFLTLPQAIFDVVCNALVLGEGMDLHDLALALKGGGDAVCQRFYKNLTGYGQAVLQAHGQFMEYPRKIDIETAQRKIISGTQHICQEVERNE